MNTRKLSLISLTMMSMFLFFTTFETQAQIESPTISIPSIGLDATIVEAPLLPDYSTWDVSHLTMNVGHLTGTSWFGGGSNTVLGGHSETLSLEPDIFYNLNAIQVNDIITIRTNQREFQYRVTQVTSVSLFDVSIAYPTAGEQLTLFTCQRGTYDENIGDYRSRVVVIAVPA